jgi:asparagine synthase (glutamine-hydrolysing)
MQADVPVGIFLSGGIDSTAILHFAAAAGGTSLRAYSIGLSPTSRSEEGALDDIRYAQIAARAYGVPHQVITLSPNVAELLPKMVRHLEDPVADPAAINCYLICQAARETSTVLLSGTGGDELFGGYRKYAAAWLGSRYLRVPGPIRRWVVEPISQRLPVALGRLELRHVRMAKKFLGFAGATEFERFLGYSSYYDGTELAELLGRANPGGASPYLGAEDLQDAWERRGTDQVIDRMTYVDLKHYLPCLGLAYMDKASMAASVEVRVPLIDDAVVDMVARLPDEYKVHGMRTKVLLRAALRGKIPDVILTRAKAARRSH